MLDEPIYRTPEAANSNMPQGPDASFSAFSDPVARLWCRSFGVSDEGAIARLRTSISEEAHRALNSGESLTSLQGALDKAAEQVIREWFSFVLGKEVAASGKALALLRLSFLDCNYQGKWSPEFLKTEFGFEELAAEMKAVTIEPTPKTTPRSMTRQAL